MELVRCISERKTMPGQLVVGKKYWIDYTTAWKDRDGDEYAQVYLDEKKEHRVGEMLTSHFEKVYRYLNYGGSLTNYIGSGTGFLLKDIMSWCLNNPEYSLAGNLLLYIHDHKLDVEENMEKDFVVNHTPYLQLAKNGNADEYMKYMGYTMCCMEN